MQIGDRMKVYYGKGMAFFGDQMIKYHGYERYNPETDKDEPCFFEGLYFRPDYDAFIQHRGKRIVFWNGSDIDRVCWFGAVEDQRARRAVLKAFPAIHLCHDQGQAAMLAKVGVKARAYPLFFGDLNKYQPSYQQANPPSVYINAHETLEGRYAVPWVLNIVDKVPEVIFHIYGINAQNSPWCPEKPNVVYHGWVEQEQHD